MTCIVGVAREGCVWIGADSAGVAGYDLSIRADRKVFRNGEFVMGFTSSFRMGQLLAVKLVPPHYHPDVDVWRYMVGDFAEAVRRCLKDGGFAKVENGVESGGQFLVGFRGRLFQVEGDFQVGERTDGFDAVGCGESFALGSLAETVGMEPEARVKRALTVAERFSAGVKGPFHIESVGTPPSSPVIA
jgi:ATP-dependent protease HslVU (ClpYQ) peptidase subunit